MICVIQTGPSSESSSGVSADAISRCAAMSEAIQVCVERGMQQRVARTDLEAPTVRVLAMLHANAGPMTRAQARQALEEL